MTTTTTKPARETVPAKPVHRPEPRRERTRRIGREVGTLAVNAYERGVADVVAFEKDVAKIAPYPWAKNALALSAELIGDVGAAYIKTARQVFK
ncbi:hypothetical protein GCM10020358_36810 [Amorphoplanes nipponensis]|uniref:Uncharacterized protein n=1 Tax=Actinoplanes nipponensis TaxID=135950 RepID=A0A919MTQ3_9ACTN|nr:hypothetical protein [Actinoplanes nipponensis]GIE53853.1 hypothetical protein Ani05nite_73870 [Actinoplanes nipponensis]